MSDLHPRHVLTPDALAMLQCIIECGSFAAAARSMGMVPSALTYRVRQIEDSLDVLLFDRSSRQARATTPLDDDAIARHRAVAVADSAPRGNGLTIGLLAGQDVFTVPNLRDKLEAQLRGIGVGFLPEHMARPYIDSGQLVTPPVIRQERVFNVSYAWRRSATPQGRAMAWWQGRLADPITRMALVDRPA